MDMSQLLRALGLQQAYQAYQQNIGQPFANVAGPFGRGLLGLDKPEYGQEQAYRTGQAVGNMPAVSAPVGAFKAAMQAPGLLADATQMAKQMGPELAGLLGLTAFHGSPHRFSKFDASKIGTGEGAQAYGHGLYFAEAPGVAKGYQTALSAERGFSYDGKTGLTRSEVEDMVNAKYGSGYLDGVIRPSGVAGSFIDDMVTGLQRSEGSYPRQYKPGSERAKLYDELRGKITQADPGSFYTVDIPDQMVGKMLDWDKPLSQQSPEIKKAFESLGFDTGMLKSSEELHGAAKKVLGSKQFAKMANDDIYFARDLSQAKRAWNAGPDSLNEYMNTGDGSWLRGVLTGAKGGNQSGGVAYKALADKMGGFGQANYQGGGQVEASRILRELGIPGIRYLDQGSRGAGTGTRNFVVFPGEEEALKMLSVE